MRRMLFSSSLALALLATCPAARAQSAADQAEARALFDDGVRLYADGHYAAACAKLEASLRLYAGIGTRGKLAECYEKVGRTASAWAMYQEVAVLAGRAGNATRAQFAQQRAAALQPQLSHLTIALPPASDVPGLVVERDGQAVDHGAMGSPVPVDPGRLDFRISAPGRVAQTAQIDVAPGAAVTFTVPTLAQAPAPATTSPPMSGAANGGTAAAVAPSAPSTESPSSAQAWRRPTALALAGTGVVAIGVGAVLALTAKSSYQSAFDRGDCTAGSLACDASGKQQTDAARSRADIGGAFIGAGAALAAGGALLYFTAPRATAPAPAVSVSPQVGPGVATVSVAGRF